MVLDLVVENPAAAGMAVACLFAFAYVLFLRKPAPKGTLPRNNSLRCVLRGPAAGCANAHPPLRVLA